MLKLIVERPSMPPASSVGLRNSPVQIWRDLTDEVCAYGYAGPGWWSMEWPRLGTFRFGPALGSTVEVIPEPGVSVPRLEDLYRRSVLPLALQAVGRETLHASAVIGSAGVLAFCGARGTGKSTVAYGLRRRGFEQHADDALVLTIGDDEITTVSLAFAPRLRPDPAQLFGAAADATPAGGGGAAQRLAAIFILRPDVQRDTAPAIDRLSPTDALPAALAHAHCFDTENPASRRRLLQNYLEIAARVRILTVSYRPGLERLELLLDTILAGAGQPLTPAVV